MLWRHLILLPSLILLVCSQEDPPTNPTPEPTFPQSEQPNGTFSSMPPAVVEQVIVLSQDGPSSNPTPEPILPQSEETSFTSSMPPPVVDPVNLSIIEQPSAAPELSQEVVSETLLPPPQSDPSPPETPPSSDEPPQPSPTTESSQPPSSPPLVEAPQPLLPAQDTLVDKSPEPTPQQSEEATPQPSPEATTNTTTTTSTGSMEEIGSKSSNSTDQDGAAVTDSSNINPTVPKKVQSLAEKLDLVASNGYVSAAASSCRHTSSKSLLLLSLSLVLINQLRQP